MLGTGGMHEGRTVGGRYRLERLLGSGGMGAVYAATSVDGSSRAAVKILHDDLANEPSLVKRVEREARLATRIRSAHVASVLSAGRARTGDLWIAFELLEGESLDAGIRRVGCLRMADAGWITEHVLLGLADAHAAGIVHRD